MRLFLSLQLFQITLCDLNREKTGIFMLHLKLPKVEDHVCLSAISPGPVLNLLPLLSGENPTDEQKNCGFYLVLFTPQQERASLNPIRKGS